MGGTGRRRNAFLVSLASGADIDGSPERRIGMVANICSSCTRELGAGTRPSNRQNRGSISVVGGGTADLMDSHPANKFAILELHRLLVWLATSSAAGLVASCAAVIQLVESGANLEYSDRHP